MKLDYRDKNIWLNWPEVIDKPVDVFYLYPTTWSKKTEDEPDYAHIEHKGMRKNAQRVFASHSMVFANSCNVFAPYYRQTDPDFGEGYDGSLVDIIGDTYAAKDAIDSFDYFIKNINKGRPFILAGHSQGSTILQVLLATYLKDNEEIYKNMVAAYIIGYSVTKEYLKDNPHLKFAKGAKDTGVIISFNTEGPKYTGKAPMVLKNSLVINPINWKTNDERANSKLNLGEIIFENHKPKVVTPGNKDAIINTNRGTVVCTTADPDKYKHKWFPKGLYHEYDYEFYYGNLEQNVKGRISSFLKK
ncbi:MAG: DUF3089 domain-containing protein [Bacilli bacterium]